ncbi:hypothetical protein BN1723_014595 [Verticillium longisporum]|uniref:Uncharacterized protein n=1 Tax=Verticillium longisporum TaxID=100787 RepID=A0A0G4ME34_VERLO|nr:hypothetical protein BN1723_014595 [Verticillium longisporum]
MTSFLTDASQPSTPTTTTKAPVLPATNGTSPVDQEPAPAVNRKKQKRRAKLAAKAAAEQAAAATNTTSEPVPPTTPSAAPKPSPSTRQDEVEPEATDEEEDREGDNHANTNGTTSGKSKKSKKKKKKNSAAQAAADDPQLANVPPPGTESHPLPPRGPGISKEKIWNTSSQEERERGFESGPSMASQPIGRPAPIGRPGSVVHGQGSDQVDDVSDQHLGSSALLDDSEEPIRAATARQLHQAPGPGPRQAFPSTPFGMDAGMHLQSNPWSNPSPFAAFGPPPGLGGPNWGNPLAAIPPMPSLANLRTGGNPRSVAVRRMLCRVCKELQGRGADGTDGFADLNIIMSEVEQLNRMEGVSPLDVDCERLGLVSVQVCRLA